MKDLSNSAAIVTGASRGIGVAIARALARRGAAVVLVARSQPALEVVCRELVAAGGRAIAIAADITKAEDQDRLVEQAIAAFGPIDLLINNAGVVTPAAYEQLDPEAIEQVLATNLGAPMTLTRRVLPAMLARDRGHIVNVASLGGLLGIGSGETYSASKHGLVGFTRALRISLDARGSKVGASVICPGFVEEVGMYADEAVARGHRAPWALGTSSVDAVARAVLRAIDRDRHEVVVSPRPIRLLLLVAALWPRLASWTMRQTGAHQLFEQIAADQRRDRDQEQDRDRDQEQSQEQAADPDPHPSP